MSTCFISYSREDQSFVDKELVGLIKALHIKPWYDRENIDAGDLWEESIKNGLKKSDRFVLVMSSASAASPYVKKELSLAMGHLKGCIIPLKIQPCRLSDFHVELPNIECIDYLADNKQAMYNLMSKLSANDQCHSMNRATRIVGNWTGFVRENPGPVYQEGLEYPVKALIELEGEVISGKITVDLAIEKDTERIVFNVEGKFLHGKYLRLNYLAEERGTIQFGSIIAALSDKGDSMKGGFVGNSAFQEDIVTGNVSMTKLP